MIKEIMITTDEEKPHSLVSLFENILEFLKSRENEVLSIDAILINTTHPLFATIYYREWERK